MEQTSGKQPLSVANVSQGNQPLTSPDYHTEPIAMQSPVSFRALGGDIAAISLLALAVVIFFWPVLSGNAWLPAGGGDSVSFLYPNYRFAADALRSGTIPFWNPYQYAGAPFLADNQSGLFYPPNLLLFLVWPGFSYRGIEWLVVWHFFFAGAAMYLCLRLMRPALPLMRSAALIGALAFMFSDVFITHIGNLNLIAVAAWLPLAFLGLYRATNGVQWPGRVLWAIGGGVALGLGTLAGHGQMTFLLATFLGAYALFVALFYRQWWSLPLLALLGAIAIGVAAISLIPAAETLQHTLRAEFDYERSTNYALTWQALTGLIAPGFFGRGSANFWGDWLRVEAGYAGILPWLLATAAVVLVPKRQTIFFVAAGGLFLLLALGPHTPLYPLLANWLPLVPFQVPARFVLLLDFCLAVLAALGFDALLRHDWQFDRPMRWVLGVGALACGLAIGLLLWQRSELLPANPEQGAQMLQSILVFAGLAVAGLLILAVGRRRVLPTALFAMLAIGVLFLDLYGLGRYVEIDWNDPAVGFAADSPALAFLEADPGLHRLEIATAAWQPNLPQIEKLFAVGGVYNPLQMANYTVYSGSVGYRGSPPYNTMGAKYVVGDKNNPPGDTNFIVPVFDEDPLVTVYLNTLALPRASVLYNVDVVSDHDAAFDAVHSDTFDPAQRLVLEEGTALEQPPGQSSIEILRYDLNDVAFRVHNDRPGYFFLSDVYHPDWSATIDGEAAEILVANYAFRALFLDEGTHDIQMRFVPGGWMAGLSLTVVTWLAIAAVVVGNRQRIYHHINRSSFWANGNSQEG